SCGAPGASASVTDGMVMEQRAKTAGAEASPARGSHERVGDEVADALLQRAAGHPGVLRHRRSAAGGGCTTRLEGRARGTSVDSAKKPARTGSAGSAHWRSGRERVGPPSAREGQ